MRVSPPATASQLSPWRRFSQTVTERTVGFPGSRTDWRVWWAFRASRCSRISRQTFSPAPSWDMLSVTTPCCATEAQRGGTRPEPCKNRLSPSYSVRLSHFRRKEDHYGQSHLLQQG